MRDFLSRKERKIESWKSDRAARFLHDDVGEQENDQPISEEIPAQLATGGHSPLQAQKAKQQKRHPNVISKNCMIEFIASYIVTPCYDKFQLIHDLTL